MDKDQLINQIVAEVVSRLASAPADVARLIDHTLIRPEASPANLDRLCQEAVQYGFHGVCVNPNHVAYAARKLHGTDVKACALVGFPLGTMTSRSKAFEARESVSDGASEVHMVMNIGFLKSKDYRAAEEDIRAVRRATRRRTILNVIIEMVLLTQEEKVLACELACKAGTDFLTSSTGFLGGVATTDDLTLMRRVAGKEVGLKANGGIRNYRTAVTMIAAGADRLGSQASVSIMAEAFDTAK